MATVDSEVFVPGRGEVWFAPVGTPKPTDLTAPTSPWFNAGHTSNDDGLTITRDGGDTNTLGSWQNPTLKVQRDPVSFAVVVNLLQVSNDTLSMYFGAGDTSVAGTFGVSNTLTPRECAMFVRIIDGVNEAPFYIPKVSLASDDDVELDSEKLMEFPVRATVLAVTGSNLMEFYGSHLGLQANEVQTITVTGVPTGGTFTLTFNGQTTAPIAYNATAAAVTSALKALSNIGSNDVSSSGGALPSTPVVVTFQGDLEDTDVAQMTANSALLTGGTSPTVTVTTTTPGGN